MSSGANLWADATEVVIATDGGTYTSDPTDNSTFTMETGEPMPTVYTSGKSMWFKYTPATSGTATFDLSGTTNGPGGSDDTEMAVYTGSAVNALTKIASDSDSGTGNTSKISDLAVTGGVPLYVQCATYNGFPISGVRLAVTGPATASSGVTGTGVLTLPTLAAAGGGAVVPEGSGALTLPALAASGAGASIGPGAGALVLPALVAAGTGIAEEVEEPTPIPDVYLEDWPSDADPEITPPVVPVAVPLAPHHVAIAFSAPTPTLVAGRPLDSHKGLHQRFDQVWGRERITMGGKDITVVRDQPTYMRNRAGTTPWGYGPGELVIPGLTEWEIDGWGEPPLAWCGEGKQVRVEWVDVNDNVIALLWRGFTAKPIFNSGEPIAFSCEGYYQGRLSVGVVAPRPFSTWKDIGTIVHDLARQAGVRVSPALGLTTGVNADERLWSGGQTLTALDDAMARTQKANGEVVTVRADTKGRMVMGWTDRESIHATVFMNTHGVKHNLSSDMMGRFTSIYVVGREADGGVFGNYFAAGLEEGEAPEWGGTDLMLGDGGASESDPDIKEAVEVLQARLAFLGILTRRAALGGYDEDTVEAVKDLQERIGVAQTGVTTIVEWNAAFDLRKTGTTLRGAAALPIARLSAVRPYNYNGAGAIIGLNPNYNPAIVDRQVLIDVGQWPKKQARRWAKNKIAALSGTKLYTGSISLNGVGLFAGNYHHGDPDPQILSWKQPLEGRNVMYRGFDGDTLFHVATDPKHDHGTDLQVSTLPMSGMELYQLRARDREAEHHPGRVWLRQHRGIRIGGPQEWLSEIGGKTGVPYLLPANTWVIIPVATGDAGSLAVVDVELADPDAHFAAALFAERVTSNWCDANIGDPLTTNWLTDKSLKAINRDRILLHGWGSSEKHIIGRLFDNSGIPYRTFASLGEQRTGILYLAIRSRTTTHLRAQQLFRPSPEVGM